MAKIAFEIFIDYPAMEISFTAATKIVTVQHSSQETRVAHDDCVISCDSLLTYPKYPALRFSQMPCPQELSSFHAVMGGE
ncbi:MAG: hypothetical protein NTV34_04570 [Proteobacteria bacterium]|nr:hypothetical protein [Pseudomonadota bacterium]